MVSIETGTCVAIDSVARTVNAVFKGGGAKGIAYAGALKAVEAAGYELASVAGASAGAITAAFVAAGYKADELSGLTEGALGSAHRAYPALLSGVARSLFGNRALDKFIEDTLRAKVGGPTGTPVTFRELYEVKKIGLYVVTLDLATGHPRVFHHLATPELSVTGAVLASSAIPGAFSPGRLVVGDGRFVNQLVDGGAWANFPLFVYTDDAFRVWFASHHKLGRAEEGHRGQFDAEAAPKRRTLGFILVDEEDNNVAPGGEEVAAVRFLSTRSGRKEFSRRLDRGPSETQGSLGQYIVSRLLGGPARVLALIAAGWWTYTTLVGWPQVIRQINSRLFWLPGPLFLLATALLGLVSAFLVILLIGASLGVLVFGRLLADTVLPSAIASLGVATGTAPWVGSTDSCTILRVPTSGLRTTGFRVARTDQINAVDRATRWVTLQLRGGEPTEPAPERKRWRGQAPAIVRRWWGLGLGAIVVAGFIGWLIRIIDFSWHIVFTLPLAACLLLVPLFGCREAARAVHHHAYASSTRSGSGLRWAIAPPLLFGTVLVVAGMWWGNHDAGSDRRHLLKGTIVEGAEATQPRGDVLAHEALEESRRCAVPGALAPTRDFLYRFTVTAPNPPPGREGGIFGSKSHLAVGDRIVIRMQPCFWELAEKSGVGHSAAPVLVVMVGAGFLSVAVRRWRWAGRASRLSRTGMV